MSSGSISTPGQENRAVGPLLPIRLQCLAQPGHVHPKGILTVSADVVAPQAVDDLIGGPDGVRCGEQQSEQRSLSEGTQVDWGTVSQHLQFPQYSELHQIPSSLIDVRADGVRFSLSEHTKA